MRDTKSAVNVESNRDFPSRQTLEVVSELGPPQLLIEMTEELKLTYPISNFEVSAPKKSAQGAA
jgi:hypothetical protein